MDLAGQIKQNEVTIAGHLFTGNYKILKALIAGNAGGTRCSSMTDETHTVYQVPTGKTFKVKAIRFTTKSTAVAADTAFWLGYGDTNIGDSSAADPTNFVSNTETITVTASQAAGVQKEELCEVDCPAGKYPTFKAAAVANTYTIKIVGYEV